MACSVKYCNKNNYGVLFYFFHMLEWRRVEKNAGVKNKITVTAANRIVGTFFYLEKSLYCGIAVKKFVK